MRRELCRSYTQPTDPATGMPVIRFLQPINVDGSSVFKLGSTVPTKFRVCDYYGNSVGAAGTVSATSLSPLGQVVD